MRTDFIKENGKSVEIETTETEKGIKVTDFEDGILQDEKYLTVMSEIDLHLTIRKYLKQDGVELLETSTQIIE
jgi:hypothetical protein